jgi:DNA-binding FadR family transcriptional regulator
MRLAGDDGERIAEPDLRFHRAIIRASGNRLFSSLAPVIGAALSVNFRLVSETPRGHTHSMPAHERVLRAIEQGDATAARLAMQQLIEDSQRDVRDVRSLRNRRRPQITRRDRARR